MKKLNLAILCMFLVLAACRKDTDEFIPYEDPIPVPEYVTGSVGGLVMDDNGNILPNISVKLTTKTSVEETVADENGIFYFRNVEINAERTYLQIEAEGYLKSSRTFTPRESGTEFLNIRLMSATSSGTFLATEGGLVDAVGGGSVSFDPGGVVDLSGNPVAEPVSITARYLNPVNNDTGTRMPGNLTAINAAGAPKILATYGMMNMVFTSDNGGSLQIASDKKAAIQFPVADELLQNAPEIIAMWYFDELMERWVEEGQAQLVGNVYEGTVGRTAFWNVAVAHDPVQLQGTLSIQTANLNYGNAFAKVTVVDNGISVMANTDNSGVLDGAVPANQLLWLEVFDVCGLEIYSTEIGPFLDDTDLGEVLIENTDDNLVQLSGQLVCNGNNITEGYVKIDFSESSNYYFVDENGYFTGNFIDCIANGFELTGFDLANSKKGETIFYEIENLIDTGALAVCE